MLVVLGAEWVGSQGLGGRGGVMSVGVVSLYSLCTWHVRSGVDLFS